MAIRTLRRRRRWRQRDLARVAGVSQGTVSALEQGRLDGTPLRTLRSVVSALDGTVQVDLKWRGGLLDRLLDERHPALVGATTSLLRRFGWEVAVEVSYSRYGERGSIDVLAAHPPTATLLVIEVKSELTSLEATLRKLDEKARLGAVIGRERFGLVAAAVARVLVLPETATARRHVAGHAAVLGAALPDRGVAVRRWLRSPSGSLRGVMFLSSISGTALSSKSATHRRVRVPASSTKRRRARHRSALAGTPDTHTTSLADI